MASNGGEAVSYLRVSGRGQADGDGFPRQRAAVERYARAHRVDLVHEFQDAGVSGTRELEGRPGLAALLDRVESNGVRLVLVERADRLARDLMVSEVILGQFRRLGVQVIAADSGTDLTVQDGDPTRTLIRQVLAAVAQFEKAILVLKLRAARDRVRARTGRCEGPKPYASEVVALIRELRRKPRGQPRPSLADVAGELNRRAVPTKGGKPWARGTVHAILKAASGARPAPRRT